MKEQLINFETAKLAKEKGFPQSSYINTSWYNRVGTLNGQVPMKEDGTVVHYSFDEYQPKTSVKVSKEEYDKYCSYKYIAPTQSLLQKWLREVHSIHIVIQYSEHWKGYQWRYDDWRNREHNPNMKRNRYTEFKTYEQALEKGLQEALKLI